MSINHELARAIKIASRKLAANKEAIIEAFLAKYGCDPADAIVCITLSGDSFIRKMTPKEIEFRDLVKRRAEQDAERSLEEFGG